MVGQRDGTVGLVAGHIVHQRLERWGEWVLKHEVEFGVQLAKDGQVEDAAGWGVDARPWLSCWDHFGRMWERGVIWRTVSHAGHGLPVFHGGDEVGVTGRDEEAEDDLRIRELLVDDGLRRKFRRFHLVGFHIDGLERRHRPRNHQQGQEQHGDVRPRLRGRSHAAIRS